MALCNKTSGVKTSEIVIVPGAPELTLVSTSRDSVSVGWELPTGTVVEEIELQWRVREIGQLSQGTTHTDSLNPPTNQYTISGLEGLVNGTVEVVVTAINGAGRNTSSTLTIHSNALRNDGPTTTEGPTRNTDSVSDSEEDDNTDSVSVNLGAIIGGAVGIFLASVAAGVLIAFAVLTISRNRQKKKEKRLALLFSTYSHNTLGVLAIHTHVSTSLCNQYTYHQNILYINHINSV